MPHAESAFAPNHTFGAGDEGDNVQNVLEPTALNHIREIRSDQSISQLREARNRSPVSCNTR